MEREYECHSWDEDGFPGEFIYGDYCYIDDDHMDERFKRIDCCGKYWVTNKSRVWSNARNMFLKLKRLDNHGHLGVGMSIGEKPVYKYIHRLVADAFIPNPKNYPVVRHLNDNPADNEIENLAWGTQLDNMRDMERNGRAYKLTDEDRERGFEKARIPVIATCLRTGNETNFRSQTDASRILNIQQANIWKVLNGERRSAGGYSFKYDRKSGDSND